MTEFDEIAHGMPVRPGMKWADCLVLVTTQMGCPADIGCQIHDNASEAVYARSLAMTESAP